MLYVEDNRANMQLVEQLIARRPDMRLFGAEDAMRGISMAREGRGAWLERCVVSLGGERRWRWLRCSGAHGEAPGCAESIWHCG